MFITAVVDHQVHHEPDTPLVQAVEQGVEIVHGTEVFHDIAIIADIVAVIVVGRFVHRVEPDHVNTQATDIVQFGDNALQVAYPIAIAVFEAARIDLIYDGLFPPGAAGGRYSGWVHKVWLGCDAKLGTVRPVYVTNVTFYGDYPIFKNPDGLPLIF